MAEILSYPDKIRICKNTSVSISPCIIALAYTCMPKKLLVSIFAPSQGLVPIKMQMIT